jgi:hypothetical protein
MTSIGGAGGKGPGPVGPADGPGDITAPEGAGEAEALQGGERGEAATKVDQLAADLDAGRITPEQAMAALIDESLAGLPASEQAELRALMEDVVAADPYLGGLLGGT